MSEERLDRIERALETATNLSQTAINLSQTAINLAQQSREDIVQLSQAVRTNTANIARLSERVEQFIQQSQSDREILQSEIRGIRTEVTRIAGYLFGQQNQ